MVESLHLAGISAEYQNDNLVVINGISIYISGNLATFGTSRFRFSDVYDFVTCLDMEGLVCLEINEKHTIKHTYEKLTSLATVPKVKL